MGIATEIVENFFRPPERRLGVDDPLIFIKLRDQAAESAWSLERSGLARKNELAVGKGLTQEVEILATEYDGESFDGEEKIIRSRNPAIAIVGQDASGDEAVEMEMGLELLVPGVEQGDKPGFAAEIVMAECEKGLSGGIEQDFQEEPFVGEDKGIEFVWESEDDVKISDGQNFSLAGFKPARLVEPLTLGAMPISAGVVGGPFKATAVALFEMAAERGSPTALDGAHNLQMRSRQRMGVAEGFAM